MILVPEKYVEGSFAAGKLVAEKMLRGEMLAKNVAENVALIQIEKSFFVFL